MIVGLTGGMGCGKTTAAGMLASHGFVPLDSDAIIRTVLLPDAEVIAAIRRHFGEGVLTGEGQVDRRQLARRVFADGSELGWLEDLLHPRLFAYWRASFARARERPWVVEVPLLFEKSLQNWFDFTVCVASHPAIQIARLEQRGLPPPLARQRISLQLPLAQKIELVDFVLLNDGSSDFLREQVANLVKLLPT
ncbi:MAG TPA: dephospho-CoA kinase [Opitutaceae bacterium]|nr:dephospho-CoA kinase [Opitutaceae bacterium]